MYKKVIINKLLKSGEWKEELHSVYNNTVEAEKVLTVINKMYDEYNDNKSLASVKDATYEEFINYINSNATPKQQLINCGYIESSKIDKSFDDSVRLEITGATEENESIQKSNISVSAFIKLAPVFKKTIGKSFEELILSIPKELEKDIDEIKELFPYTNIEMRLVKFTNVESHFLSKQDQKSYELKL